MYLTTKKLTKEEKDKLGINHAIVITPGRIIRYVLAIVAIAGMIAILGTGAVNLALLNVY